MKIKTIVLLILALIGISLIYSARSIYHTWSKYEEMRTEYKPWGFEVKEATEKDLDAINTARSSWNLIRESVFSDQEKEVMRQLGYSDDVGGLVQFWSDSMPEFSLFDQERNALWVSRATYYGSNFPVRMEYCHTDKLLFAIDDRYAEIYEDTEGQIHFSAYVKPD